MIVKLKQDLVGYKAAWKDEDQEVMRIVKLRISKGTKVHAKHQDVNDPDERSYMRSLSPSDGQKLRAARAEVVSITSRSGSPASPAKAVSDHDVNFVYRVGRTVKPGMFADRNEVCAGGIHFFLTRKQAKGYFY